MPPVPDDESSAIPPSKQPPPARTPWGGISDTRVLQELEQRLCRCLCRVDLFGGSNEMVAEYGHEGMAGLLIQDAYDFLEQQVPDLPTRTQLGWHIIQPSVRLNVLSKFLAGTSPRGTDWFRHARTLLRYLLLGDSPDSDGQRAEAAARIDDYFFRNFKAQESTPFFRRARRQHGTPCSHKELAGELAWVTRQRALTTRPAEVIWVSGGPAYFPTGTDTRLTTEVATALQDQVRVTFVYHPGGGGKHGVKANLDDFFTDQPAVKDTPYCELDLSAADQVDRWWEYCSGAFSFLYLAAHRDTEIDETLYYVRGSQPGQNSDELIPLALRATAGDLEMFLKWWGRVKHLAVLNPDTSADHPPLAVARTLQFAVPVVTSKKKDKKKRK